jgi:hypothetical protein
MSPLSAFADENKSTAPPPEESPPQLERFKTVQEVVDYVLSVAPPAHLRKLKQYSKWEFLRMDMKRDQAFDERLGLSDGNTALLEDAGTKSPRRAWDAIRTVLWEEIQKLD